MGALSPTHWLVVLVVLVLLFGAKKLPEMARSIGRSSRIFRSEVRAMESDAQEDKAQEAKTQEAKTQNKALTSELPDTAATPAADLPGRRAA